MHYTNVARYYVSSKSEDFDAINEVLDYIDKLLNWGDSSSHDMPYEDFIVYGFESFAYDDEAWTLARDLLNSDWEVNIQRIEFQRDTVFEVSFAYRPVSENGLYRSVDYEYSIVDEFLHKYNLLELLLKAELSKVSMESCWDCISLGSSGNPEDNVLARGGDTPDSRKYEYVVSVSLVPPTTMDEESVYYLEDVFKDVFLNSRYSNDRVAEDFSYCYCYLTGLSASDLFKDILCSEVLDDRYRMEIQALEGMGQVELCQYLETAIASGGLNDAFSITLYKLKG